MHLIEDDVFNQGYATFGELLDKESLDTLRAGIDEIFLIPKITAAQYRKSRRSLHWETVVFEDGPTLIASNALGKSHSFDEIIGKVFENKMLKHVLESVLGKNYRIWNVSIRRASPGDSGLGIHQDTNGELGVSILLDDYKSNDGATVILPRSHLKLLKIREMFLFPLLSIKLFNKDFLKPIIGPAGSVHIFLNRLWHGRFWNQLNVSRTSILVSCMAEGAIYPIHIMNMAQLTSLDKELRRRLEINDSIEISGFNAKVCNSYNDSRNSALKVILSGNFEKNKLQEVISLINNGLTSLIIRAKRMLFG